MSPKVKHWLKYIFQTALMVLLVSVAVDWWRKPAQPLAFAEQPLVQIDGRQVSLNGISSEGTAVIYFWGSWCGICRYTSPVIQRLHHSGIPVLSVDMQSGSNQEIQAYMREKGLDFATVNDADGSISSQWQVAVTPTVVVVKNGKMIHSTTGLSSYWGLRGRIWLADLVY